MGFLTASARNDWTSTLERENDHSFIHQFLYLLPFDALKDNQNLLESKIWFRYISWLPGAYSTRIISYWYKTFQTAGGTLLNYNAVSNFYANPGLTPEIHKELELGIEGKFFKNKVGVDISMFTKDSEDLIIDLDLDASTGYTSSTVNSASINNKGIEAIVNFIPVQSRDFTWEIAGQFSLLRSEVLTISDGVDQIYIGGKVGQGNIAIPGLPFGVMEGDIIKRDYGGLDGTDHTQVHWDDRENSLPYVDANGNYQQLGLVLSVIQILTLFTVLYTLTYKWLTAVQFDASVGGMCSLQQVQLYLVEVFLRNRF